MLFGQFFFVLVLPRTCNVVVVVAVVAAAAALLSRAATVLHRWVRVCLLSHYHIRYCTCSCCCCIRCDTHINTVIVCTAVVSYRYTVQVALLSVKYQYPVVRFKAWGTAIRGLRTRMSSAGHGSSKHVIIRIALGTRSTTPSIVLGILVQIHETNCKT